VQPLLECLCELGRRVEPVGRHLGERPLDGLHHPRRRVGTDDLDRRHALVHLLGEHGLRRRTRERRAAGHHLVHHAAEGVDVRPVVDLGIAGSLLGAHVGRRADGDAGVGDRIPAHFRVRVGDAEVGDDGVAVDEEDVLGLDVAVDHLLPVRVREAVGDLGGDARDVVETELPFFAEEVAQAAVAGERHDVVQRAAGGAGLVEREEVDVLEVGDELDLALEAFGADGRDELGTQDLHGDLAVEPEVPGEEDDGHATVSDLAQDLVPPGKCGGQASREIHSLPPGCGDALGYAAHPESARISGVRMRVS
jgi:hypothetical protein